MMSTRGPHIFDAVCLRAVSIAGLSVVFLHHGAKAGDWKISPSATLEQSFTDNVRSVSTGAESDMITTATGGIGISGTGRRLQMDFTYNISQDKFWDASDQDGLRQSLLGVGKVEVIEELAFVDTRASISQVSLTRTGGASATDRTLGTNDQSTVVNYSITPNYGYRYGSWAESDVSLSLSETRFLETDVGTAGNQPDASRRINFESLLRSGQNFNKWSWTVSGSTTFTDNNSDRDILEFSNEYAWTRQLSLLGTVGRETIENSGINADDSAELFWSTGFRLKGSRTDLRLEYGERFGGPNWSGDASYRFSPKTAITASYAVSVESDRERLTQNLNDLVLNADNQAVDPDTNLPGNPNQLQLDFLDQTSKNERFSLALSGTRGRNTFSLTGTHTVRTQLQANTEDEVVSFGGNISRRIWPDLTGGASARYSAVIKAADGINDYEIGSSLFLNYSIFTNFSGRLQYSLLYRNSDNNLDDLQENVISVSLSKTF